MDLKRFCGAILFLVLMVSFDCAASSDKEPLLDQEALFQLLDRNKDGRLNAEEFQVIWKDKSAAMDAFRSLDKNADGYLSQDEFGKPGLILFSW